MKTIEEKAIEYTESKIKYEYDPGYFEDICKSFMKGVEFAQRWISIDEELPPVSQQVIVKLKNNWHTCTWLLGDGTFAYNIKPTHWRYIDLK